MNWDDLRYFLAVARTGQMLGAGQRLGVNHATVARRIDALEADLNARLFVRRPIGCSLTDAGETFLAAAERVETEMRQARAAVTDTDVRLSGTVRVGAPDGFGTAFLAPRLWRLSEDHPDLVVQLVPLPRLFSLSRREADIAITVERPLQGRLVSRMLTDYELGLYASPDYLIRHGRPEGARDLGRHRLVGHVEDLIYAKSLNYAADIATAWRSSFEVSSALGQAEAVAAGAGIGILHRFVAERFAELTRLLPDLRVTRTYWLVVHESAAGLGSVRHVADGIAELVKGERRAFSTGEA
jgi:DNA-binding transcriptional LysR family regulator